MKIVLIVILAIVVIISLIIAKGSRNPHFKNITSFILIMTAFCLSMAIVYAIGTSELPLWLKLWLIG